MGKFDDNFTEESDTAFKVFGGFKFNPHFGVELGYADFGEFSAGDISDLQYNAAQTALTAALVGYLPLGPQSSLFGKIGMASWDIDGEFCDLSGCEEDKFTATESMIGIGWETGLSATSNLRIEFERFHGDVENIGDLLSVGVTFKF